MKHCYRSHQTCVANVNGEDIEIFLYGFVEKKIMDEEKAIEETEQLSLDEYLEKYSIYMIDGSGSAWGRKDRSYIFKIFPADEKYKEDIRIDTRKDSITFTIKTTWENIDDRVSIKEILDYPNNLDAIKYLVERGLSVVPQ